MSRKLTRRTDEILGLGTGPEISTAELLRGPRSDHLRVAEIPLDWIHPNPDQPRKHFDETALAALAASIAKRGLLQPVVVQPQDGQSYLLLAGERRLRAFRSLGRERIPALIRDPKRDGQVTVDELALIENVQRVDLNAVELAGALARLAAQHGYSQRDLGEVMGRDVAWVSRLLAVRALPPEILDAYLAAPAAVSMSALIEVACAADPETRQALWQAALQGASVRVLKAARKEGPAPAPAPAAAEKVIARSLGTLRRTVDALRPHRGDLAAAHRDQLLALRREIDTLLGE